MSLRSLIVGALFVCGCYEYLPPPSRTGNLSGKRVQVTLNDAGSALLAPQIGPYSEAVAGTLVDNSPESVTLSVLSVRNRNGLETGWNGERVSVPRAFIAAMDEKRFSIRRTLFAGAALAAGVVVSQRAFGGSGGANAPGGSPGGTPGGK